MHTPCLDTFAYRNPHPGLRVFEVDHPATQAWQHQRLAAAGIDRPEMLTFVPVDFEAYALATGTPPSNTSLVRTNRSR
ncbi:class I SAM-dependent methyltransferase [Saccharopolyspora sp. ASAGF58]|uniref:class I SAM-dependent methyltransferase n=1 Tax=Saccharopolyspora sp. ASAGF58 TaxID=2719023 RepID=UPI0021132947|nr:class I SAM-dependent methyltransferase [Saccharopolyspora sp. ASAGF58]